MLVNKQTGILESSEVITSILVVEDDAAERLRLELMLKKTGYAVSSVNNGQDALQYIDSNPVDMIISDWKMPIMDGLHLCRNIRANTQYGYPYFILLTGCDTKPDLIAGMDAGADDFITKPFNGEELRVRLQAGDRIQQLKHQLESKNKHLEKAYKELKQADESLNKDLKAAAYMQQELLPKNNQPYKGWYTDSIFNPASCVSGDFFNIFKINDQHMGFYHIDASGHGVSAAMMSFNLARLIGGGPGSIDEFNGTQLTPQLTPCEIVHKLNLRFQSDQLHMPYFTLIYGILNIQSGEGSLCQAGHPYPFILRNNGDVEKLGKGGFPVGALNEAHYEDIAFILNKGERLFIYSDGITECINTNNDALGEIRLTGLLRNTHNKPLADLTHIIDSTVTNWRGEGKQLDDISALLIEHNIAQENKIDA